MTSMTSDLKKPVITFRSLLKVLNTIIDRATGDKKKRWLHQKVVNKMVRRHYKTKPSRKFNEIRRVMHKNYHPFPTELMMAQKQNEKQ